jgi:hypothetical protein
MPLKVQGPVGRYSAAYVEPFLSKLPVVPSMDAAWLLNKSSNEIVVDGKGTSEEETIPKYESKTPQSTGMPNTFIAALTDHTPPAGHAFCTS